MVRVPLLDGMGATYACLDKLYEMGVKVHATYQDEGGMFEGEYLNGEDNTWEPEFEEEES